MANFGKCQKLCSIVGDHALWNDTGIFPLFPLFSGNPDSPHSTSLAQIEAAPKDQEDAKSELLKQDKMMRFYKVGMGGE